MDELIELVELVVDRKQETSFTKAGKPLYIRPMPLRLALKIKENEGVAEISMTLLAEVVARCVVFEDGAAAFNEVEVLDGDSDKMIPLFMAVSRSFVGEDAAKN